METMTTLQKATKALENQVGAWFGDAILNGAKIEKVGNAYAYVDGVLILKPEDNNGDACLLIRLRHEELNKIWKPSTDDLQTRKAQLEDELTRINNQLKEAEK